MTGNKKVFITGATGFLGSHIAEEMIIQGWDIIALKRKTSNLWRCQDFSKKIHWVDSDNWNESEKEIINFDPELFIHAAWNGINDCKRDIRAEQEENLTFLTTLLNIVKKTKINSIIALGSQAEYGYFEGCVNEDFPTRPISEYGKAKLSALSVLRSFAEKNSICWYWLRIFSVFGPRQDENWIIPAAIIHLLKKKEMLLTPCEQRYDYLFTRDFVSAITSVIKHERDSSGVYNLSGGSSIRLKEILIFLEEKLSCKEKIFQIGALPYRENQVMHLLGNSDRFYRVFNFRPQYNIYQGLDITTKYYIDLWRKHNHS